MLSPALLRAFVDGVDNLNDSIGRALAWLLPLMTGITLAVVVLGSVFRIGFVWLGEVVVYCHAALFTLAAAHTLRHEGHVRIDLFYAKMGARGRACVNLFGVFVLLLPTCAVIIFYSYPYVASSWQVLESSPDAQGLPAVFLLKTCLLIMPALLALQGLALAAKSALAFLQPPQ